MKRIRAGLVVDVLRSDGTWSPAIVLEGTHGASWTVIVPGEPGGCAGDHPKIKTVDESALRPWSGETFVVGYSARLEGAQID